MKESKDCILICNDFELMNAARLNPVHLYFVWQQRIIQLW